MSNSCHRALLVATFAFMPCAPLLAQAGVTVSGAHATEAFCKTILKQADVGAAYLKSNPGLIPDKTKQGAFFTDMKAMNATLVKTAPASLTSEIVNFIKISNAYLDAQLSGKESDRGALQAAGAAMSSPEHIATSKHVNDYCGVKMTASK